MFQRFMKDESGATAIEYGLIAVLLSLAIVVGVGKFASGLQFMFGDNSSKINEAFNYH